MTVRREFWQILATARQWDEWLRQVVVATDGMGTRRLTSTFMGVPGYHRLVIEREKTA